MSPGGQNHHTNPPTPYEEPSLSEDLKKRKHYHNTVITPNKINSNSTLSNSMLVFDFLQFSQNYLFTVGLSESESNQHLPIDLAGMPPHL